MSPRQTRNSSNFFPIMAHKTVLDFHHFRINHSELFADKQNHINGIEKF